MEPADVSHSQRRSVVFVTPDPEGRGGMATVVRGLLASSLAERYDLSTITTHRLQSRTARARVFGRGLIELATWCVQHRDGVVHVHSAVRGSLYRKAIVILLARALRRPVVFQLHAGPGDIGTFAARLGPGRRRALGAALRRADVVLAVSDASAQALRAAFGPLAVDVLHNAAPAPSGEVTEPTGAGVLYVGGFANPVKGGEVLVRALPRLLASGGAVRVVAAGPGDPPPGLSALLGERVEWRGWLDDEAKARALREAAVFVLPSTSEGLPMALLEAMGYGRAIVATRVGGVPDTISDGVDGVLVEPGDADALAEALVGVTQSAEQVRRLGAAARLRAEAFGAASVVDRLDAVYGSLR